MELRGSVHTIRQFEYVAKELVKNDMARVLKLEQPIMSYRDGGAKEWVVVYQVFVGDDGWGRVNVRFWYDSGEDRASIRISQEGVDLLLQSATVVGLMLKMGKKVSKNGSGVNLYELEGLLKKATFNLTGKEENIEIQP